MKGEEIFFPSSQLVPSPLVGSSERMFSRMWILVHTRNVCVCGGERICHGFPHKGNCKLLLERVYIWLGVGVNGNREGGGGRE